MPFCPKCRYEYKPGITKCPDCSALLVDELPEKCQSTNNQGDRETVCIASYQMLLDAQLAKVKLEAHGISSYIANEMMWVTSGIDMTSADGGIKLNVRKEDAGRARKALAAKR